MDCLNKLKDKFVSLLTRRKLVVMKVAEVVTSLAMLILSVYLRLNDYLWTSVLVGEVAKLGLICCVVVMACPSISKFESIRVTGAVSIFHIIATVVSYIAYWFLKDEVYRDTSLIMCLTTISYCSDSWFILEEFLSEDDNVCCSIDGNKNWEEYCGDYNVKHGGRNSAKNIETIDTVSRDCCRNKIVRDRDSRFILEEFLSEDDNVCFSIDGYKKWKDYCGDYNVKHGGHNSVKNGETIDTVSRDSCRNEIVRDVEKNSRNEINEKEGDVEETMEGKGVKNKDHSIDMKSDDNSDENLMHLGDMTHRNNFVGKKREDKMVGKNENISEGANDTMNNVKGDKINGFNSYKTLVAIGYKNNNDENGDEAKNSNNNMNINDIWDESSSDNGVKNMNSSSFNEGHDDVSENELHNYGKVMKEIGDKQTADDQNYTNSQESRENSNGDHTDGINRESDHADSSLSMGNLQYEVYPVLMSVPIGFLAVPLEIYEVEDEEMVVVNFRENWEQTLIYL